MTLRVRCASLACLLTYGCAAPMTVAPAATVTPAQAPLAGPTVTVVDDASHGIPRELGLDVIEPSLSTALLHGGFRVLPNGSPHHLELFVTGPRVAFGCGGGTGEFSASWVYSAIVKGASGELIATLKSPELSPPGCFDLTTRDEIQLHETAAAAIVNDLNQSVTAIAYAGQHPPLLPGIVAALAVATEKGGSAPAVAAASPPSDSSGGVSAAQVVQMVNTVAQGVEQVQAQHSEPSFATPSNGVIAPAEHSEPHFEAERHEETHHASHAEPCPPHEPNCRR
jgi:hypothetical protein